MSIGSLSSHGIIIVQNFARLLIVVSSIISVSALINSDISAVVRGFSLDLSFNVAKRLESLVAFSFFVYQWPMLFAINS